MSKKKTDELKAFYFEVNIRGVARVYAYDKEGARQLLDETGVSVCGNKMIDFTLEVNDDIEIS